MSDQHSEPAEPSGLPQSELGGLHPELRARMTVADGVVKNFKREFDAWMQDQGDRPDYVEYSIRLAHELHALLDTIGRLS